MNCLGPNASYWDLLVGVGGGAGTVTVQNVNFMNAPGTAAVIDGPNSVIKYSTFAYGSSSQAARSTGLALQGSGDQALYNSVNWSGTAGIGSGPNAYGQWIYGNFVYWNRCEEPDNVPGGQLYTSPPDQTGPGSQHVYLVQIWSMGPRRTMGST
ncbi:MAG TPA: hypothetical protein VKV74_17290 [Bryobacteraceae bacterium]|nr:hypothetical protein [Bryobacteraceae bacterium]